MAVKRPLADLEEPAPTQVKRRATRIPEPTAEFEQVSLRSFIDQYKVDLGYGSEVYYQSDFIAEDIAGQWYHELMQLDTYRPMLKMYGRSFPQSRLIAAYATSPDATLSYSGTNVTMHSPFPPIIEKMRSKLEEQLGVKFNHVMLNRYDDGSVYIGKHSDNLNELVIASVSLGAPRSFIMSPRLPPRLKKPVDDGDGSGPNLMARQNKRWVLANGSLVVMQGRTQEYWKHEIPKEPKIKDGRISLTFRQHV